MKHVNVGIDLGTTYSAVAIFDKTCGAVKILPNDLGNDYTPSVVCIENGKVLIGEEAKDEQASRNPNTAAFYKSYMGDDSYTLYLDGKDYTPEDLSSFFLRELKQKIEKENDVKIDNAVITVPAYFEEKQRSATMRAGKNAGLNVLKIINEPTAAIIAYGLRGKGKKTVLVYDLGGGTFDVTIAEVNGTDVRVLATKGNHQHGGKDWDAVIVDELIQRFRDDHGIDINDYPDDYKKLQVTAEETKKKLTSVSATTVKVSCDGYTGKYEITREFFEERTASLLNTTAMLIEDCFDAIKEKTHKPFGWNNLNEVVLVGGSTRMPQVKEYVRREYGKDPLTKNINVDTIVASGAAMECQLCVDDFLILDTDSSNIESSIELDGFVADNPDTMLVLPGDIVDITGHSLGMLAFAKVGDNVINSIIVPEGSKMNEEFGRDYTFDGDKMDVYVLQGEDSDPHDCTLLYKYIITGMKKAGDTGLTVNFMYNKNGMVDVNARTKNGKALKAEQQDVTESLDAIIAKLKKERQEALEAAKRARDVEVMFVIDVSGSMSGDPIKKAIAAIRGFVDELNLKSAKVSVLLFGNTCGYTCRLSSNKAQITKGIDDIYPTFDIGTYGWGTSARPLGSYGNDFYDKNANRIIVVLTDGVWTEQNSEVNAAQALKRNGTTIYAIGFGDADKAFLDKLATSAGKKVNLNDLGSTLKQIASSIATEA